MIGAAAAFVLLVLIPFLACMYVESRRRARKGETLLGEPQDGKP